MTSGKEGLKDFCNQVLCSSSYPTEKQLFGKYQTLLYLGLQYCRENRQEHTSTLQEKSKSCPLLPAMPVVWPVVIGKALNPVSVNPAQLGHQQVCGLLLSPGIGVALMLHAQPVELG